MNGDARGGGAHLMMIDDGTAVDRVGRPLLALRPKWNRNVGTPQGGPFVALARRTADYARAACAPSEDDTNLITMMNSR